MGDKALNQIDTEKTLSLTVTDAGANADESSLRVDGAFITGAERNGSDLHLFVDSEITDEHTEDGDRVVYLARAGSGVKGPYLTERAAEIANRNTGLSYVEPRTISEIPDDGIVYLGFSTDVVCGPFAYEQDAVDAVSSNNKSYHVEPRRIQDDGTESCIADDVQPTY